MRSLNAPGAQSVFRALKHRPFAWLWTGQIISRFGDSLQRIALTWYLVEKTGSATAISRLFIFTFVPNLVFLLLGGVAVDRFPRLRVMLLSDLARGLLVGGIAALAFVGRLEVWHLYVMVTIFGLVDAFFQPAYVAVIPELTPTDVLPSANALTDLSGRIVGIIGPAVSALLITLGGTSTAFALNALSFFISTACLLPLWRLRLRHTTDIQSPSVLADAIEGLTTVLQSPWLWVTIVLFALVNVTLAGPLGVALPLLIKKTLRSGVDLLGVFSSLSALGAVLTAVVLGRKTRVHHRGVWAYGATMVGGIMLSMTGLSVGLGGLLLAAFVLGATTTTFGLIWTTTLQEMVPRDVLGRVSSVDQLGSFALLPIGYALAGWMTDRLGPPLVLVIGGVMTTGLIALGLLHPAIRRLD
ncbi:MAG: MFS transporter [Herpetosiphonaceae bacterium]|nr:MFS transporter [Herpetosiphonaceae bacterium]